MPDIALSLSLTSSIFLESLFLGSSGARSYIRLKIFTLWNKKRKKKKKNVAINAITLSRFMGCVVKIPVCGASGIQK